MSEAEKKPKLADPVTMGGDPPAQAVEMGGDPPSPPAQPGATPSSEEALELDPDAQAVLDEIDMRDLLRSALAPPQGAVAPDLLHGVQRKLRRRSRGKFYGDGWSTARSPRLTYLVTSVLMLVLMAVVFLVLIPWGDGALP